MTSFAPVIGTPGGSLADGKNQWASNRDVAARGREGEKRTARLLNRVARADGPTVLHDLTLPVPERVRRTGKVYTANVDHVVVSGRRVTVIDSKQWCGGTYWTLFGKTRIGWKKAAKPVNDETTVKDDGSGGRKAWIGEDVSKKADKRTLAMTYQFLDEYFRLNGVRAQIEKPVLVAWASGKTPIRFRWYRPVGGVALTAEKFERRLKKLDRGRSDPEVVAALQRLVKE